MLDSCHPPVCQKNIPYSLAMRIVQSCTCEESIEIRLKELEELLMSRGYIQEMVTAALKRAQSTNKEKALRFVVKLSNS